MAYCDGLNREFSGYKNSLIGYSACYAAKWNIALNNAKNVQDELGVANVDIEIVAFGSSIQMRKFDSAANSRVSEATNIIQGASYVPAGVVQIMRRQGEGWACVWP
jgi:uncharacterized protein